MQNNLDQTSELLAGNFNVFNNEATLKQQQQQAEENYRLASTIAAAFKTQGGQKALRELKARFLEPPTWVAVSTNLHDATAYGFSREGQKSVIQWILNCIEQAEKGPPQPSEVKKDGT